MKIFTFILSFLGCILTFSLLAQPESEEKRVFITNEATINSDGLEYSPAFLEDGIVFISTKTASKRYKIKDKRINANIMSIFRATREADGLLNTPEPFANELLSRYHEGPVTFDRTADNIFFTRNNYSLKSGKKIKAKDGIQKMQIYASRKIEGVWQDIEKLPFNDDESNSVHPSISVEGDALYFASDRPGGYGGMDIWVVYRAGGVWSEPENLGAQINTEGDEVFPYIHADGTLYFSSTGHEGFGGLDLFTSQNYGGSWSTPVNMGIPFNSESDDLGFIVDRDKKNGYFSSNRPGGLGQDDIYSFYSIDGLDKMLGTENIEPKIVSVLVSDYSTAEMIDSAVVTYAELNDEAFSNVINTISNDATSDDEILLRLPLNGNATSGITDSWGKYPMELVPGSHVILVNKAGYQGQQVIFNTASEDEEIFVSLEKESENAGFEEPDVADANNNSSIEFPSTIKEGTVFQLPNIYYNFNDASIRPDAKIDLDALATFLTTYPDIEIELSSHTDSRGGTRYNRQLSQRRAENAVKYLVSKGIDENRMAPVGHGESHIRNRCTDGVECTELEHQYNRRTEVKITKMSQEINIEFINDDKMPQESDVATSGTDTSENTNTETTTSDTTTGSNFGNNNDESEGQFKVIAGVYREEGNAQKKLNLLNELGYDPQIIVSNKSGNHSVVVGSYKSMDIAKSIVETLKREHKIRSFIRQ